MAHKMFGSAGVAIVMLFASALSHAHAESITLDPPLKVIAYTTQNERIAGEMTAYSEVGFTVRGPGGEVTEWAWSRLDGRNVYLLHSRAFGKEPTAEQWFALGVLLRRDEADAMWSDRAFREALKRDGALAERIEAAKNNSAPSAQPPADPPDDARPEPAPVGPARPDPSQSADPAASDAVDPLKGKLWETFTAEQQARFVEEIKAFAESAKRKINAPAVRLYESEFLLLYTDLDRGEAMQWQALIGKMYDRMLKMWALPEKTNVWRGKALIFVFKSRDDFVKYESIVEQHDVGKTTAGICHSGPFVRIAFYRQPDQMGFATVLVHETSHGFMHRYRSPRHAPSWINEGLAEWIAYELVPKSTWLGDRVSATVVYLTEKGDTGGMFDMPRITGEQYGIAYTLTKFMIEQNKKGYTDFITAVKDGKDWRQALEEDYGVTLERLVAAYGQWMRVAKKPLRP